MAVDLEAGRAALAEWAPRLAQTEPLSFRGIAIDKLATGIIGLVEGLGDYRARFEALVGHGWSIASLNELPALCNAILACVEELAALEVASSSATLSPELKEKAPMLRARMMKVLRYWLADDADVGNQLDSIRSGTGFRDLAKDLGRLSTLYATHAATLAGDGHLYNADDAATARTMSNQILNAIAISSEDQRVLKQDQLRRLHALVDARYSEVRAAGRFLLRDADGETRFPGARMLAR